MTRPLGSTPTAPSRASQLLRAGPPARPATVLTAFRFQPFGNSLSPSANYANGSVGACLPTFRAKAADRAHVAYMPDTAWPENADTRQTHPGPTYYTPVLMSPY